MIQELRDDTPGCKQRIHLNNAGASLPPQPVLQAMQQYLELESTIGGYEAVDLLHDELQGFYDAVAKMLGTQANNIAYAGSATDAYAKVLSSIPWQKGDVIVTSENDYSSNRIAFLALKKRFGVEIIPSLSVAISDAELADLESLIKNQPPKLLAISHIPTNNGLVQPVEAIGKILRNTETLYLVDACQSAGQMRLDVNTIGCDFLTATMRKFMRGPRGAGFLYASDRVFELGLEMMLPDMPVPPGPQLMAIKPYKAPKDMSIGKCPMRWLWGRKWQRSTR
ncbi:MAG: aminotransferase class V-fold PLP-dependent enzyme [Saprospiraceae bacterium]